VNYLQLRAGTLSKWLSFKEDKAEYFESLWRKPANKRILSEILCYNQYAKYLAGILKA